MTCLPSEPRDEVLSHATSVVGRLRYARLTDQPVAYCECQWVALVDTLIRVLRDAQLEIDCLNQEIHELEEATR